MPARQLEKQVLIRDLDRLLRDKRWNLVDRKTKEKVHLADLREMTGARPFGLRDLPDTVRRAVKGPGFGDVWLAMVFFNADLSNVLDAQKLKAEVGTFAGAPWVNLGSLLPAGVRVIRVEGERAELGCAGGACLSAVRQKLLALRHQGKPVIARVLSRAEAYEEELAVEGGLQGEVLVLARPHFVMRPQGGAAPVEASGTYHVSSGELVLAETVALLLHDGRIAFGLAFLAVFLAVLADFRSLKLALLAFLPLVLGFVWTFGIMSLIHLKVNLFNFVILPSLLGIGIDYGVHYVHRYKEEGEGRLGRVMRCLYWVIFFCAATTVVGFGNVALASHPGLKSLGNLAIIGITCIFFAATYTLPALLYALERWRGVRVAVAPASRRRRGRGLRHQLLRLDAADRPAAARAGHAFSHRRDRHPAGERAQAARRGDHPRHRPGRPAGDQARRPLRGRLRSGAAPGRARQEVNLARPLGR